MAELPTIAMVMAAGLGTRMRPLTDALPKPLIKVDGRTLVDRTLDRLVRAGVQRAVVNVHYLAEMMIAHLATRHDIAVTISDERGLLLETGGGIVKARTLLGHEPFFTLNTDVVTIDGADDSLKALAAAFDPATMDALMLLVPRTRAVGHDARGDFSMDADGRLVRRPKDGEAPYVWTGAQIVRPDLFDGFAPGVAFSQNKAWDRALERGRLYGIVHGGDWLDIGTPAGLKLAEDFLRTR